MTGLGGAVNIQGEDQKKLDIISNEVLKAALQYTGKLGMVAWQGHTRVVGFVAKLFEKGLNSKRYENVLPPNKVVLYR